MKKLKAKRLPKPCFKKYSQNQKTETLHFHENVHETGTVDIFQSG